MPDVDVIDSSWIGVQPSVVAAAIAEPARWRGWWPDLDLRVAEWRGAKGVRWTVRSAEGGRLAGTMEIWLQPAEEGVVAHYFLRLDSTGAPIPPEEARRLVHRFRIRTKALMWALTDELDPGRLGRVSAPPQP